MRRVLVAGNWKMHKTPSESREFARDLVERLAPFSGCDVVVAPAFTALSAVREVLRSSSVGLAAQDCHWHEEGAFTGEVSAAMLADAGCEYVIVGHSERRQYFGETDDTVRRKIGACLETRLNPIFCLGETLEERESGRWQSVVKGQLEKGLASLTPPQISRIIIAYEPVWAIGSGKTATPDVAQQVHAFIRRQVAWMANEEVAGNLRILYGGSVKPGNTEALMQGEDIDGTLVGGASLDVESFLGIVAHSQR